MIYRSIMLRHSAVNHRKRTTSMEKIQKLYTAEASATGGRNGHVKSSDGVLNMDVRTPRELGGGGGEFTNPEQLFAAGYAA